MICKSRMNGKKASRWLVLPEELNTPRFSFLPTAWHEGTWTWVEVSTFSFASCVAWSSHLISLRHFFFFASHAGAAQLSTPIPLGVCVGPGVRLLCHSEPRNWTSPLATPTRGFLICATGIMILHGTL